MTNPQFQGEMRPSDPPRAVPSEHTSPRARDPSPEPGLVPIPLVPIPLVALRDAEREATGYRPRSPDECRVPRCPVCAWRRAGLIPPAPG